MFFQPPKCSRAKYNCSARMHLGRDYGAGSCPAGIFRPGLTTCGPIRDGQFTRDEVRGAYLKTIKLITYLRATLELLLRLVCFLFYYSIGDPSGWLDWSIIESPLSFFHLYFDG
jgi:hypothetical protein